MLPMSAPVWLAGLWFFFFRREGKPFRALGWAWLVTAALILALNPRIVLPVSGVSGAVRRRQRAVGAMAGRRPRAVDQAGVCGVNRADGRGAGADHGSGAARRDLHPLFGCHASSAAARRERTNSARCRSFLPTSSAGRKWWPRWRASITVCPRTCEPRTAIFGAELWPGRRGRSVWPEVRPAQSHQRTPELLPLGTARLHRREHDRHGGPAGRSRELFQAVRKVARVEHPYSMPYEHFDVFYCRGLKWPLKELWPQVKNWD